MAELGREGIGPELLIEAGLLRADDPGTRGGEFFFNRVMFPIRDRRGRGDQLRRAHPGRRQAEIPERAGNLAVLQAAQPVLRRSTWRATALRGGAGAVVVVEGYLDVIALHQAGFGAAVAPLGTALTEEQLTELWRLSPAPVLCFDGDAAGARAGARAAELALPLLAPDRSLKLATLPAGEDPDSLVNRQGAGAFHAVLAAARPLSEALYDLLAEAAGDATPEQRAALRHRLEAAAKRIPDQALAQEYRSVLLDRFFAARPRRPRPGGTAGRGAGARPPGRAPGRTPPRPVPSDSIATAERVRILLAILLRHPSLLADVGPALAGLDLPAPLGAVRAALADWAEQAELLDFGRGHGPPDGFWIGCRGGADPGNHPRPVAGLRVPLGDAGRGRGGVVAYFRADASRPAGSRSGVGKPRFRAG